MNEDASRLLRVEQVSKSFPGVQALADVNLDLNSGEILALVGENGAGKSTLIQVLTGALEPDTGSLFLSGDEVHFSHPQEAEDAGISAQQTVKLAYKLDRDSNAAANMNLKGRVLLFVAKGKVKNRKNAKNPMGEDHQFSGKIYSYLLNNGKLDFKDKYTGTGGWNPVSEEMALEVLGLNVAKRWKSKYLKHIKNN